MHQNSKTQYVLITGATGLLGTNLLEKMIVKGSKYQIVALGNSRKLNPKLKNSKIKFLKFDLTQPYSKFDELNPYSDSYVWIHIASAISGASFEDFKLINIEGTKKLVRKAEELDISRFVLISSMSVYGPDHPPKVDEIYPENPQSEYGKSKLKQEQIVRKSKIPWTIIRPSYIGGPYDKNFLEELTKRIKNKSMPRTSKRGKIAYIDARDLSEAIKMVIKTKKTICEIYNIQETGIYFDELQKLIGKTINVDPPFGKYYPYWFLIIVGWIMEIWGWLSRKSTSRRMSRYRIKTLTSDHTMDISKLQEHIDFKPKHNIEKSIQDWFKWKIQSKS